MQTIAGDTKTGRLFIGGEWVDPVSGDFFDTVNPANGSVLGQVANAGPDDVDLAVQAARSAFDHGDWPGLLPAQRARILWRIADLIEEHGDELAQLETLDQGAPFGMNRGFCVANAADHFRYYAGWATKIEGTTVSLSVPDVSYETRREPIGVCALITPWNVPLMLAAWKLAPALSAGNTVVLKPAEQTPLSTLRLAELCAEAGVPAGVVNVITGGPETGAALVRHPGVDKISFTGSTEVGREIVRASADTLKRVSLELGGKAPSVIAADADIDAAVAGNLESGLINAGQACAAYTRFFVDRARADEFVEKLATAANAVRLGDGTKPESELGPLVSEEHLARVDGYVQQGRAEGAQLVTGGERADGELADGYFYRPTVFADVADSMTIARDEIFGPVLCVFPYDDPDELAARANDTDYGLVASIWTRDLVTARRLSHQIRAGAIYINLPPLQDPAAPWGGMKSSGIGREMGREGIEAYTEVKGIWTGYA
jgi:aldehyde dehydrogenase (NAD+)/betaine-aldehyde dehydrogenase